MPGAKDVQLQAHSVLGGVRGAETRPESPSTVWVVATGRS
jgi:hypothetical protein